MILVSSTQAKSTPSTSSRQSSSEDWKGNLYCRITLDWNYKEGFLDISMTGSMTGYVEQLLLKIKHKKSEIPLYSPHHAPAKLYGTATQDRIPEYTTKLLNAKGIELAKQVMGEAPYYVRAIDNILLIALRLIASKQTVAMQNAAKKAIPCTKRYGIMSPAWC